MARHDGRPLIKRIARIEPAGPKYWLLGDNPAASTDSRQFGSVARDHLVARIITRLG
jgi:type IV secretory pathway protease TraF